ncbi:MAG: hypothetical protein ACRDM1_12570 [Gaiellaceae bacterium]
MADGRATDAREHGRRAAGAATVTCVECRSSSGLRWAGWRAYRVDEPELNEPPTLAFYCPTCAAREFGEPARDLPAVGE